MKRCAHCYGSFGLARRTAYYVRGFFIVKLQFCSANCERAYNEERQRALQANTFKQWLYR